MVHRLVRGLLAVALMTGAAVVAAEAPAFAAVGACRDSNPTVSPCVNYGDSGTNIVRADFYLKQGPSYYLYYYNVVIVINGQDYWKVGGFPRLTSQGRYCCWYQTYDNLPNTYNSAYTRVYIFRQDYQLYMTVTSPTINFWS